jgi:hypothetical protein
MHPGGGTVRNQSENKGKAGWGSVTGKRSFNCNTGGKRDTNLIFIWKNQLLCAIFVLQLNEGLIVTLYNLN